MCPALPRRAVHPHACGEYGCKITKTCRQPVHPHACGEYDDCQRYPGLKVRFTPTRVGNTYLRPSWLSISTVHPHACGEYVRWHSKPSTDIGSPPRVWGIRCGPGRPGRCSTVHPHACGEYASFLAWSKPLGGSPPRVWGIPMRPSRPLAWRRFTPTRVGNTGRIARKQTPAPVHPHACGEYYPYYNEDTRVIGSPPRVWGIQPRQ